MVPADFFSDNERIADHPLTEEEELYKENIIDHYKHPRHLGRLGKYSCTHLEHNPLCGDRFQVYLSLDGERVTDVSFEGQGCAISMASMSLLSEKIMGMSTVEVRRLGPWDIFNLLGIKISHTRSKCALLSLKAVQQALALQQQSQQPIPQLLQQQTQQSTQQTLPQHRQQIPQPLQQLTPPFTQQKTQRPIPGERKTKEEISWL
ncbi:MAG TPA: iron-sulfur cluster assembly scaffold protein [Candidatus Nanoarchaeia archaeon]|nr:iron-sulfur cluster assembly scaffold protein [Candidatus Nanoarchaeia archaeon]